MSGLLPYFEVVGGLALGGAALQGRPRPFRNVWTKSQGSTIRCRSLRLRIRGGRSLAARSSWLTDRIAMVDAQWSLRRHAPADPGAGRSLNRPRHAEDQALAVAGRERHEPGERLLEVAEEAGLALGHADQGRVRGRRHVRETGPEAALPHVARDLVRAR